MFQSSKLLTVLHSFGIKGRVFNWIESFLSNRRQRVKVSGTFSEYKPILSGSLQGSVLGPLVSLLFLSGSSENTILGPNVKVASFADDNKYYLPLDHHQDGLPLQITLDNFSEWAKTWQLTIATYKCHVLRLGPSENRYQYSLNEVLLPSVRSCRDLGVLVDDKLCFSEHIHEMLKTAYRTLHCLFRVVVNSDKNAILHGYLVFLAPMSYEDKLKYLGLELLEERRIKIDLCMMFQLINGNVSTDFTRYFKLSHYSKLAAIVNK